MKKLYENTKQFILNNYDGELDSKILDFLTVSTMALFLRFPNVSKERMPNIFGRLEIFFDDVSVPEMVYARYPEYPKGELTSDNSAFVLRALGFTDDNKFEEEWSMYVSTLTSSNSVVDIIARTAHELIHLLRFGGIIDFPAEIKIRDGVSVARYNKETGALKRKHYNLEEGVVEFYTIEAMNLLFESIKNEDVSFSPALEAFKNYFTKDFKAYYGVARSFLDELTRDTKFCELLEYSFVDASEPLQLVSYYNNCVGNSTGFTSFSRGLDRCVDSAAQDNYDAFSKSTSELLRQIEGFLAKKKN